VAADRFGWRAPLHPMHHLVVAGGFLLLAAGCYRVAPAVSRRTRLPLITVYLVGGLASQLVLGTAPALRLLLPMHDSALGCITIAAGSELMLEMLRSNWRTIGTLTLSISGCSLAAIFALALPVLSRAPELIGGDAADTRLHSVVSAFAAVVAICRSPSSAIAVVSELRADGPFTQTVLGVTMVTDVLVILLFSATTEMASELLAPPPPVAEWRGLGGQVAAPDSAEAGALNVALRFSTRALLQIGCSALLGAVLAALCVPVLRMPFLRARQLALLLVAAAAFVAEASARRLAHGAGWALPAVRVEPMLACIVAGFAVCNLLRRRDELGALLHATMPPVLASFFRTRAPAHTLPALVVLAF